MKKYQTHYDEQQQNHFDVSGEEKKKLTVADLLEKFRISAGEELSNDRI